MHVTRMHLKNLRAVQVKDAASDPGAHLRTAGLSHPSVRGTGREPWTEDQTAVSGRTGASDPGSAPGNLGQQCLTASGRETPAHLECPGASCDPGKVSGIHPG